MSCHKRCLILLLSATMCVASALHAQGADQLESIRTQQTELRGRLERAELSQLTQRQQNQIRRAQTEVFKLIDGKSGMDDLNIGEKVRLENALERINANLVGTRRADGGKQVCKRVPVTGSAMKTTRCATQQEWDEVREQSRKSLEKQRVCEPPGCG